MKRFVISIVAVAACIATAVAEEVPQAVLHQAAANFWNSHRPQTVKAIGPADLTAIDVAELPHLALLGVGDEGFVILSADDRVQPVLAYSFDSPLPTELHPSLRYWLGGYEAQIAEAVKLGIEAPQRVAAKWDTLLYRPVPPQPISLISVPALCATRWDQSDMNNSYNRYCPYDSVYHERTVVGCVATAMAQIMKRWNHPSCGTGNHSYTPVTWPDNDTLYGVLSADFANTTYYWANMPNQLQPFNSDFDVNAVAMLSYHCGVAVDMMYGPATTGGSGAYVTAWAPNVPCSEYALRDYFRYDSSIFGGYRADYDSADWIGLIEGDLGAGRPILYTGSDSTSAHAFVLDGADTENRYHFNWGWSGYGDGYYAINNLAPGAGGAGGNATFTFNQGQSAVFSIFPVPQQFDTIHVSDTVCSNASVVNFYDYQFEVVDHSYQVMHLDTVIYLDVTVIDRRYVYMNANFEAMNQTSRSFCPADSTSVPECPFRRQGYVFHHWNTKANGTGVDYYLGQKFKKASSFTLYAQWADENDPMSVVGAEGVQVDVWPNPTTGLFTVGTPMGATVAVYDAVGRVVTTMEADGGEVKIDLSAMANGVYSVQVRSMKGVCNRRIIKQ